MISAKKMQSRFRRFLIFSLIAIAIAACQKNQSGRVPTDLRAGATDTKSFESAARDSSDWPLYGRTSGEQRFSPLSSINADNVRDLKLAWYVDLPAGEGGEESTPLVIGGVMYVTTAWTRVMALDAASGKVLWQYDPKVPREWRINTCCDVVNRGVAFWEGKVYVGTIDGRLVAINAQDGKPLWETLVIDRGERASITGAPRVIKGRVYIGSAGGEFGVRGRLTAVDADTGAILWRFFTVPGDPTERSENPHLITAARTWSGRWWARGGGGTVWDAMSYDPALDLLYIGTGNGSPWPQSIRSPDGGDNLYVSSILALRAETGELVWYYQTTPGDEWGFDAASQMVLTELNIAGRVRSVLIQAAANGFLYVLDRATGELISATPFVPINWAKGVDLATGRPEETPRARYSMSGKPFVVQPSPAGAHSWEPMSFDPLNGLLYIPAMVNAAQLSVDTSETPSRYALTFGAVARHPGGLPPDASRLIAWDPIERKAAWSVDRSSAVASGVLATAGSLVFQGTTNGTLEALTADTGRSLWKFDIGTSVTAAPISYEVNGTQMIAVEAGAGGARVLAGGILAARETSAHNFPRLLAFTLQGRAQLPPVRPTSPVPPLPARFGTPAQLARGKALYDRYCERCHGEDTINVGPLEELRRSTRLADSTSWQRVVYAGLLAPAGMPGFIAELNPGEVEAIRAYVVDAAQNTPLESGKAAQSGANSKRTLGDNLSAAVPHL